MDAFQSVLGARRGRSMDDGVPRVPPGVLARLDDLCAELSADDQLADDRVVFLARGYGFDAYARGSDDYLLCDHKGDWSVAVLAYESGRWQTYVCRELVFTVRTTGS